MRKENRPHMLNNHPIHIYRELRAIPNFKIYRMHRNICTLSFGKKLPSGIPISELNHHFGQYGTIIRIDETNMKITFDEYAENIIFCISKEIKFYSLVMIRWIELF